MCSSTSSNTHASVQINEGLARMTILEAQIKRGSTSAQIAMLAQQNAELKNTTSELAQQNAFLHEVTDHLHRQRQLLLEENANLTQKLSALENQLSQMNNTNIPDTSAAGCPGLHRRVLVLEIYLNQSIIKLKREVEALNSNSSMSDTLCLEAHNILESGAVQLLMQNPMYALFRLKQSLETLNTSLANTDRN
ncbi:hypothetical protein ACOMHN_061534 [Nucella lapillus]